MRSGASPSQDPVSSLADGVGTALTLALSRAAVPVERHAVPIKAQDHRWAWVGVKHGAPEGGDGFHGASQSPVSRRVPPSDKGAFENNRHPADRRT